MFRKFSATMILSGICLLQTANADQILTDWSINVNGTMTEYWVGDVMEMSGFDVSEFDQTTGIGELSLNFAPGNGGEYFVAAFFDLDFSRTLNSYSNEIAIVNGIAPDGLTWEADEPGWVFGDIYGNLLSGTFDGINTVDGDHPDDVSVGLGWHFTLEEGQTAEISFAILGKTPADGFYITHSDPESNEVAFLTTSLNKSPLGGTQDVPEPSTIVMMLSAGLFAGVFALRKRK